MAASAAAAKVTKGARTPMTMVEMLSAIKSWKVASFFTLGSHAKVDNVIFNLHSKITVTILTICTVFVGMKQYFGEPIECLNTMNGQNAASLTHAQLQHYCWMEGAFTVANRYASESGNSHEITGQDNSYPGVTNYKPHKGDSKVLHKYYQWVYYILCIQCLLFYTPKHIWKIKEGGRLRELIDRVKSKNIHQYEGLDRYQIVQDTLDVILTANQYFSWIIFCEILFLVHLIAEIFFVHAFLGGKFLFLGIQWIHYSLYSEDTVHDPLIRLFPRLTKCSFHKFGVTGSIETYDTLCFMPLNIVNEKIFVIIWFWFLILFLVTLYHIFIYRAVYIMFPWARRKCIHSLSPYVDNGFVKKLSKSPGRCFVVQLIASNMKPYACRDLLHQVLKDHFSTKNYRLESRVSILDFIVDNKVPESKLPTAPLVAKPDPPGFKKSEEKSSDSGCENGESSTSTSQTTSSDDGWGNIDAPKKAAENTEDSWEASILGKTSTGNEPAWDGKVSWE